MWHPDRVADFFPVSFSDHGIAWSRVFGIYLLAVSGFGDSESLPGLFSVTVPDSSCPWHTSGVDHLARALREEEPKHQDSSDIHQ